MLLNHAMDGVDGGEFELKLKTGFSAAVLLTLRVRIRQRDLVQSLFYCRS